MLIRVATDVLNDSGDSSPRAGGGGTDAGLVDKPDISANAHAGGRRSRYALWTLLVIVVFVAFPVRLYLALTATMISRDGATFIWYAQGLARDPAAEMRTQAQHPLYPALVLAAHTALQAVGGLLRPLGASVSSVLDDPVRSWTLAGVTVSLLGGLTVVIAVYALARLLFDRRVALLAAMLAALAAEFCQLSADVLTDMPHLTLYLLALCAAIRGFCPRATGLPTACPPAGLALRWLFLAGALSGLAFLMRPEGAGVAVVAAAAALGLTGPCRLPRRLVGPLVVVLGAGLVASPYMLITGKLVQKKSLPRFLPGSCEAAEPAVAGWQWLLATCDSQGKSFPFERISLQASGTPAEGSCGDDGARYRELTTLAIDSRLDAVLTSHFSLLASSTIDQHCSPTSGTPSRAALGSVPADVAKAAGLAVEHWGRALRLTLLLPAIAWLFLRKCLPADRTAVRLVTAAGSLHFVIVVLLVLRFDYADLLSVRHTMILAGLTLPFSAAGVAAILDLVPARRRVAVGVLVVIALVAPTAPWMFEWRYAHEAYLRRAGEWIRSQQPSGAKVHTTRHRVAFYANGIHQWSPLDRDKDIARILAEARAHHSDWLVFDVQRVSRYSPTFLQDLEQAAAPGELTRAHVEEQAVKGKVQRAIIYRYRPPA